MAGVSSRLRSVLWLKGRLMENSLRSTLGITKAVIWTVVALAGAAIALLVAGTVVVVLLNVLLPPVSADAAERAYTLVLGILGVGALLTPFAFGEVASVLDPKHLLLFPMTQRELYGMSMGAGALSGANLVWYPTLAAAWLTGAIEGWFDPLIGCTVAALAATCFVAWQQLMLNVFRAVFTSRRLREVVSAAGMMILIGISLLPEMMHHRIGTPAGTRASFTGAGPSWIHLVLAATPPHLAARAMVQSGATAVASFLELALWTGAGLVLGWRAFTWELERTGTRGAGGPTRSAARPHTGGLPSWLPPDIAAVAAKHLRYVLRSTTGKMLLVTAPLIGLLAGVFAGRAPNGFGGLPMPRLVFFGLCLFAAGFLNRVMFNSFLWDHGGLALYFLVPVRARRILLGLNIGLSTAGCVLVAEALATWSLVRGVPHPFDLLCGALIFANTFILATIGGNVTSILFPVPSQIGSGLARSSTVSGFVWMGVMTIQIPVSGLPLLLSNGPNRPLVPVLLGIVLVLELAAYRIVLPPLGLLLERRREHLLEAVASSPAS